MKYTFFVLLRARPEWLALSREQRSKIADTVRQSAFAERKVETRFFDAEAFSASPSDVMMIETEDPKEHYFLIEALRDTELFTVPYFDLVQIIPAIEDGFQQYEAEA